jgi:hypothetical protein
MPSAIQHLLRRRTIQVTTSPIEQHTIMAHHGHHPLATLAQVAQDALVVEGVSEHVQAGGMGATADGAGVVLQVP